MSDNDNKVVEIVPGAGRLPSGQPLRPNARVVEILNDFLKEARAGKIMAVGVVSVEPDKCDGQPAFRVQYHHDVLACMHQLLVGSALLKQFLVDDAIAYTRPVEPNKDEDQ